MTASQENPQDKVQINETENLQEQVSEKIQETEEIAAEVDNKAEEVAQAIADEAPAAAEETAAPEPQPEAVEEQPAAEKPQEEPVKKTYHTKQEILDRVREIAHSEDRPQKGEIDQLKTAFYKLHLAEREAQQQEYLKAGGDPEKYQVAPDAIEEQFKAEMGIIREKRAKLFRQQEEEKAANLERKQSILEQIKGMITSPEEANKSYQKFKALQQEWREIKSVPAEKANELWRNYQHYVEQFYDLLKLNNEAREYDFKKNLEQKTKLCEEAEKLAEEDDVIKSFHQLQELHQRYREIGPVAKDLREQIWNRFKAASTTINKRHQQHYEQIRGKEEENLEKKTALCEKVEAIAKEENKGAGDWEKHTKQIIDVQAEWKKIGFAPQKMNVKIFERFRAACDDFFGRKAEYFKGLKDQFTENAAKKKALVEQAEALKDSTEWKETSEKLIQLQKEWRTIGMVPKKLGDQLWKDFLGACNHFFEARNAANAGTHENERDNLKKKREIIEKLKDTAANIADDAKEKVLALVEEFQQIGHVPYKEKDKVYEEYKEATTQLFKDLGISLNNRRNNFRNNVRNAAQRGEEAFDNERSRLMRKYDQLKQEIQTYENNLGFLNVSSKKGNSLIDEMNKKVQKLKDEFESVRQRILAIDHQEKEAKTEQPAPEATADDEEKATDAAE